MHAWLTSGKCRFDRFRNRLSNTLRGRQQHEDDHPGNGRAVDARDASLGATKRNHAGLRDYVWQRCWNAKRFNTGRAGYRDRARECGARCHVRVQNFTASAGANCNCGQHDDWHDGQVDDDQSKLRINCEAWIVIRTCPFIKALVSLTRWAPSLIATSLWNGPSRTWLREEWRPIPNNGSHTTLLHARHTDRTSARTQWQLHHRCSRHSSRCPRSYPSRPVCKSGIGPILISGSQTRFSRSLDPYDKYLW